MRGAPVVLHLKWDIYAKAKRWEMASEVGRALSILLPDNSWGWIHWAYSLHELRRTKEAQGVLMPIAHKFADEYIIQYNLACYTCQLGELKEALQWLERAIDFAGKEDIRLMALDDADLEPLWNQISEI
jgi:predicted Zn-dependent protease